MDMVDETITVTTASKVDQNDPHYVFAPDLSDIQKAMVDVYHYRFKITAYLFFITILKFMQ